MAAAEESDDMFEGMILFGGSPPPDPDQSNDSASSSVPLDENLFSDLTLVTVTEPEPPSSAGDPSSPSSSAAAAAVVTPPQRQNSIRKKKRGAALRIGYGRDKDFPPNSTSYSHESSPISDDYDEDYHHQSTCPYPSNDQIEDVWSIGNLNDESRLEEIRKLITEKVKRAREAVNEVSAARKESIRRRRKTAEKLSRAAGKYREVEKVLEEACEAEDFEKAERVSEHLSSAEQDRELLVSAYKQAEAYCDTLDSKMKSAIEYHIQAEEESASLFQSFAADASHNADLLLENAKESSSKEMDKWLSSTEEVELRKMELDIESHLVHEARLALNESIEHSVEDDQKERDLLYKRREILREDMQRLLLLVKEKEAEICETDSKIERVEKRISGVVSCLQAADSQLDTMYNELQSALCQVDTEYESLSKRKKEAERLLGQEETRGGKIREISRVSQNEANMLQEVVTLRKNLLQFILQSLEDKLRLTKTEEKLSEDVHALREGISGARASLQELSSSKLSIQQKVESLNQRLLFVEKRVPELEAEKKVAATARNFREAARIATEAKTLAIEKEGLEINIENATLELKKLEEQICKTIKELQETESWILAKEKELAMARFQRLILIADAATAERSAALELGDLEEAEVLLAESEASAAEARKIQLLYDFKNEDIANTSIHFLPMELASKLGHKQLAELMTSLHISP